MSKSRNLSEGARLRERWKRVRREAANEAKWAQEERRIVEELGGETVPASGRLSFAKGDGKVGSHIFIEVKYRETPVLRRKWIEKACVQAGGRVPVVAVSDGRDVVVAIPSRLYEALCSRSVRPAEFHEVKGQVGLSGRMRSVPIGLRFPGLAHEHWTVLSLEHAKEAVREIVRVLSAGEQGG